MYELDANPLPIVVLPNEKQLLLVNLAEILEVPVFRSRGSGTCEDLGIVGPSFREVCGVVALFQ